MKNHPLYKKLKQIALDKSYTIEQARNLSFSEAKALLGGASFSLTFLNNMKSGIVMTLQNRDDEQSLQSLKQQAKSWLDSNFPGWEAEHGRQGEYPFVTIWLKGKPE